MVSQTTRTDSACILQSGYTKSKPSNSGRGYTDNNQYSLSKDSIDNAFSDEITGKTRQKKASANIKTQKNPSTPASTQSQNSKASNVGTQTTTGTSNKTKLKTKSTNTKKTLDISFNKRTGTFNTNLPLYNSLNITSKKALPHQANGVDIYVTNDNEGAVTLVQRDDGSTKVSFAGSEVYAIIPKQTNPKNAMIVYNEETRTMAFHGIEGLEVLTDKNKDVESNILVDHCGVSNFNTVEDKNTCKHQNIVFNNSCVAKFDVLGDSYLTLGNTVLDNTNNHPEKANGYKNLSYWASDGRGIGERGQNQQTTNGNGQSGFTVSESLKWFAENRQEKININTADPNANKKFKLDFNSEEQAVMSVDSDFTNVPLSRTSNGVEIYVKGGNAKSIRNVIGGHNSGAFYDFNGTMVKFPPHPDGKGAKIYFEESTEPHTLIFENIDELEINYAETQDLLSLRQSKDASSGAFVGAKVILTNCKCKHVNFMETNENNTNGVGFDVDGNTNMKSKADIYVDKDSEVENLLTRNDRVYLHSEAKIGHFAGTGRNNIVRGQELTNEIDEFKKGNDIKNNFQKIILGHEYKLNCVVVLM